MFRDVEMVELVELVELGGLGDWKLGVEDLNVFFDVFDIGI